MSCDTVCIGSTFSGALVTGTFCPVFVISALCTVSSPRVLATTVVASASVSVVSATTKSWPPGVPRNGADAASEVMNFVMIAAIRLAPWNTDPAAAVVPAEVAALWLATAVPSLAAWPAFSAADVAPMLCHSCITTCSAEVPSCIAVCTTVETWDNTCAGSSCGAAGNCPVPKLLARSVSGLASRERSITGSGGNSGSGGKPEISGSGGRPMSFRTSLTGRSSMGATALWRSRSRMDWSSGALISMC